MIIAGDVGGTKTILPFFEAEGDSYQCVKKQRYSSADYQTFIELPASFLSDADYG